MRGKQKPGKLCTVFKLELEWIQVLDTRTREDVHSVFKRVWVNDRRRHSSTWGPVAFVASVSGEGRQGRGRREGGGALFFLSLSPSTSLPVLRLPRRLGV